MSTDDNIPRPKPGLEIATTRDGVDITRGYAGPLLVPADRLLRQRGGSDLSLYEQVLSDPKVMSTFRDRRNAVVQCEWRVDAASERRVDKKAADHVRLQLQRIGFDRVTDLMLFGVFYGYSVAEMIYDVQDGLVGWQAVKVRNRRRFRFSSGERAELRMLTQSNMFEGEALPPRKFWSFATGSDNDDEPYGLGLAHWCYWPVLFKRNGIKFWLTFLDKFGAPTGVGKFDPTASTEEQARLLAAVQAIRNDSGVIVPKGMEIELLEAARSGSVDYKALHDTMDAAIAQAVIGQTASTQGTPGRLGNDQLQSDVRDDLVKADADLKCESLNRGPVEWLTRWNFPDADPPRVYRVTEEEEDLSQLAERDTKIFALGYKPTLKYVQDTYGGEWTEKAPEPPLVDLPNAPPPPVPAQFAAPPATPPAFPDQAALEHMLDAIDDGTLDAQAAQLLKPLVDLAASDPQAALDAIAGVLPDVDDRTLQNTLARALFVADAWGRFNA